MGGAPRRGQVGGRDQGLHLGQQRALALDGDGDAGSRHRLIAAGQEKSAGIGQALDSPVGQVEAADLALALAVASAAGDLALPTDVVAVGEVGLAGEVRRVTGVARRLVEAARLGFGRAMVPRDCGPYPDGMYIVEVSDLPGALAMLKSGVRAGPQSTHR